MEAASLFELAQQGQIRVEQCVDNFHALLLVLKDPNGSDTAGVACYSDCSYLTSEVVQEHKATHEKHIGALLDIVRQIQVGAACLQQVTCISLFNKQRTWRSS